MEISDVPMKRMRLASLPEDEELEAPTTGEMEVGKQ
jgi:hypothetical protein